MTDTLFSAEIYFVGRVQGVGFRYATLQVAKEFEVTGEVKNLSDGRVFLKAQGREMEVRGFVDELKERMDPFIRETEEKFGPANTAYKSFEITH